MHSIPSMMVRPMGARRTGRIENAWTYLILDGYVDEPAALGVPPFLSPQARSIAGGLVSGGAEEDEVGYITVDQWRSIRGKDGRIPWSPHLEWIVLLSGCVVPGKYLRGTPISNREVLELEDSLEGPEMVVCGPAAKGTRTTHSLRIGGDPGVLGESLASSGKPADRDRTEEEWSHHLKEGAFIVEKHPDHPFPLICEIETTRGCPRFITGGCSFCSEPGKGPHQTREPLEVVDEVRALSRKGTENIRIGGQSDLLSYGSDQIGREEAPRPDPRIVEELMSGAKEALHEGLGVSKALSLGRRLGIDTGIVHTDNANPAVAFHHPEETKRVLEVLVRHTTPGTVLALGLESTDPEVREASNLNAGPEEARAAVMLMNEIGADRGENGMPRLLPGLNFLGGLRGQTPESFRMDLDFLKGLLSSRLLLRRINIRGVRLSGPEGAAISPLLDGALLKSFKDFKEKVRGEMDPLFMGLVVPERTVLRGVFIEAASGHTFFGRQIGSYPILVGISHRTGLDSFRDIVITRHSSRSLTGIEVPVRINSMSFRDLQCLPGVSHKRAAGIFRSMPIRSMHQLDRFGVEGWVTEYVDLGNEGAEPVEKNR
ncbi:MAG: radical SAM protein [Thermoplasmatota archaeon]